MPVGKKKIEAEAQQENFLATLNVKIVAEVPKHKKPKHQVWHQHDRYLASLVKPIIPRKKDEEVVVVGMNDT